MALGSPGPLLQHPGHPNFFKKGGCQKVVSSKSTTSDKSSIHVNMLQAIHKAQVWDMTWDHQAPIYNPKARLAHIYPAK